MDKEKNSWKVLAMVVTTVGTICIFGWLGLYKNANLSSAGRLAVYAFGVFMAFFLGLTLVLTFWTREMRRVGRQLSETRRKKIRLPMSLRTVTLGEFRKMWGAGYPEKWRQEEGE